MSEERSYDFLLEFYLRQNVYGSLAEFNKQNFPDDYANMKAELEHLTGE